jgi:hypothetical protein
MSVPATTAPGELKIEVTAQNDLRLLRGKRVMVLSGRAELERVAHQCWDLAVVLADEQAEEQSDGR